MQKPDMILGFRLQNGHGPYTVQYLRTLTSAVNVPGRTARGGERNQRRRQ